MSRGSKGLFSREDHSPNIDSSFLEKSSVLSSDQDKAIFDRINEILGNKSRYATVDEAVKDFQKRTGLSQYLQMCEGQKELFSQASSSEMHVIENLEDSLDPESDTVQMPKILVDHPDIHDYINNFVKSRNGFIHVPAVIESIRIVFRNSDFSLDELDDKHLKKFINEKIIENKSNHPQESSSNLGKVDLTPSDSNSDAFALLMPVKSASESFEVMEEWSENPELAKFLLGKIKEASTKGDWKELGNLMGQFDAATDPEEINAMECIRCMKYLKDETLSSLRVPQQAWLDFTIGYGKGWGKTEYSIKKDIDFTKKILERINK